MRKLIVAVVMAVALAACTVNVQNPAEEKNTTQLQDKDRTYADVIREEVNAARRMSDDQLVEVGNQVCKDLRTVDTLTHDDLKDYMMGFYFEVNDIMSPENVGYIVGASIMTYCPEFSNIIDTIQS